MVAEGLRFWMIRDSLIPLLEQKFGVSSFTKSTDPNLIASFPPAHLDVGELRILDDGNEIIVEIGKISHGHFGSLNETATREEAEKKIVEKVADFIEAVFQGKCILWLLKQQGPEVGNTLTTFLIMIYCQCLKKTQSISLGQVRWIQARRSGP